MKRAIFHLLLLLRPQHEKGRWMSSLVPVMSWREWGSVNELTCNMLFSITNKLGLISNNQSHVAKDDRKASKATLIWLQFLHIFTLSSSFLIFASFCLVSPQQEEGRVQEETKPRSTVASTMCAFPSCFPGKPPKLLDDQNLPFVDVSPFFH